MFWSASRNSRADAPQMYSTVARASLSALYRKFRKVHDLQLRRLCSLSIQAAVLLPLACEPPCPLVTLARCPAKPASVFDSFGRSISQTCLCFLCEACLCSFHLVLSLLSSLVLPPGRHSTCSVSPTSNSLSSTASEVTCFKAVH